MMPISGLLPRTEIPFRLDLLDLHCLEPSRYPALLESTADDRRLARYDILFAFPQGHLRLAADGGLTGQAMTSGGGFLDCFDADWLAHRQPLLQDRDSPFSGGWFVLLGYELANEIEPHLALRTDSRQPVAVAIRVPVAIVRDRQNGAAWIVAEPGHEANVQAVLDDIARLPTAPPPDDRLSREPLVEEAPERFLDAVDRAKDYIAAGDIYQANLSRQWLGRMSPGTQPADIYRRLRDTNPAPFAGLLVLPDIAVISSSPERLLRTDGRRIETRPIAGTRPRDLDVDAAAMRRELHSHPKERAEHVMLIDLERNDLGRVCQPGSVTVDEFMVIESYAHVHHIVSNVSGVLRDDATPGTMIRSVFPGGSITGCPKVRCMQIIHELENRPRGAYTGAMGYFNRDGSGDLNILIRSITVVGDELSVATGSGIVADSDPRQELEETRAKARGLLLALGIDSDLARD